VWTSFYDQAEFVSHSVRGVRDAILIGVALAALVLLVFLRDVRATLVAVATIPVSVALVLLGLGAAGQTINLMTLGGIAAALGLVADDAIVVVENVHRHRELGLSDEPSVTGLKEIFPALLSSSLSTIVVFAPFALLTGVVGAFFKPLALTMAIALGVSFLLAAWAVPPALGGAGRSRADADAAPWSPSPSTGRSTATSSPRWTRARSSSTTGRPPGPP
jgi:multidrug efflux pump subunit AcrB